MVREGQLRAYILSDEGREITLYRLFQRDICLFSAACAMGSLHLDIALEAEKDTEFWLIPPEIYRGVMESSAPLAQLHQHPDGGTVLPGDVADGAGHVAQL